MKMTSQLFDNPPIQWGLRGDPLLWEEMKLETAIIAIPDHIEDLEKSLQGLFYKLTRQKPEPGKDIFIPRYKDKSTGMSKGFVCSDFWIEKGFPLILQRYTEI